MTAPLSPMLFLMLAAVLAAGAVGFVCVILLRALARERARRELTPADLKALESAAADILAEVRQAADDAVARIREQIEEAQAVCAKLESLRKSFGADAEAEPTPSCAEDASTAVPDAGTEEDVLAVRVRTLADSGLDAREIARETGMGIGEVELLLGLSSRAGTPA